MGSGNCTEYTDTTECTYNSQVQVYASVGESALLAKNLEGAIVLDIDSCVAVKVLVDLWSLRWKPRSLDLGHSSKKGWSEFCSCFRDPGKPNCPPTYWCCCCLVMAASTVNGSVCCNVCSWELLFSKREQFFGSDFKETRGTIRCHGLSTVLSIPRHLTLPEGSDMKLCSSAPLRPLHCHQIKTPIWFLESFPKGTIVKIHIICLRDVF